MNNYQKEALKIIKVNIIAASEAKNSHNKEIFKNEIKFYLKDTFNIEL